MQQKRDAGIDIARGLAIFSVVFGHIETGLSSQLIYLFHMPFFFMVSGYFHKRTDQELSFLKKKALSLLVPYFIYLFVLMSPSILRFIPRFIDAPSPTVAINWVKYILKLSYGGETLQGEVGIFWFVTCLFLTQQLFNFISNRVQHPKMLLGISGVFYGLACLNQLSPIHIAAPWAANVVLCAFPFYAIGAVYGSYIFERKSRQLAFPAIALTVAGFGLLAGGHSVQFGMKHGDYGYFLISPLAAIAMTHLLVVSTRWLSEFSWIRQPLVVLGTSAVTVMYLHRAVEYNLPAGFPTSPLLQSIVITIICCGLHWAFTKIRVSRAFLLGSYRDFRPRIQRGSYT